MNIGYKFVRKAAPFILGSVMLGSLIVNASCCSAPEKESSYDSYERPYACETLIPCPTRTSTPFPTITSVPTQNPTQTPYSTTTPAPTAEPTQNPTPTSMPTAQKSPVICYMDDMQAYWFIDVAIALTELHIEKGVDLVNALIPYGVDENPSLVSVLQDWHNNYRGLIELAQQGYDHSDHNDYTPEEIEVGKQIFDNMEISVSSWAPPWGEVEWDTPRYLEKKGYRVLIDPDYMNARRDTSVLVIDWGTLTDVVSLGRGELKSVDDLMKELDANIAEHGVGMLSYYVFNFADGNDVLDESKLKDYGKILQSF